MPAADAEGRPRVAHLAGPQRRPGAAPVRRATPGHQGRLLPMRRRLLRALPAGRPAPTDGRHRHEPHRLSLLRHDDLPADVRPLALTRNGGSRTWSASARPKAEPGAAVRRPRTAAGASRQAPRPGGAARSVGPDANGPAPGEQAEAGRDGGGERPGTQRARPRRAVRPGRRDTRGRVGRRDPPAGGQRRGAVGCAERREVMAGDGPGGRPRRASGQGTTCGDAMAGALGRTARNDAARSPALARAVDAGSGGWVGAATATAAGMRAAIMTAGHVIAMRRARCTAVS